MKVSIKFILIFGLLGVLFISVFFTIMSSYLSSEKAMLSHAKDIMTNISTFTIEKSQNYLFFARDAARLTSSLADTNVVSRTDKVQMEEYFYKQLSVYPQFSGIYYGNIDGSFTMVSRNYDKTKSVYRTKIINNSNGMRTVDFIWKDEDQKTIEEGSSLIDQYDPRTRRWYIKAVEEHKLVWTSPYIFYSSQKPGITTSSPVYGENGKLQGVVGVDIEIDEISDFLSKLTVGKNGLAFIFNKNGDVIAFPDKAKITQKNSKSKSDVRLIKINEIDEPITRKAFASLKIDSSNIVFDEPVFTEFNYEGENYHAMFAPFTNDQWEWSIGLYLPENDYLGTIKESRLFNFYILGLFLFIYGIIAFIMAKSIEKPLAQLEKETVLIAAGDLDVKLSVKSHYKEIQNMADSFLIMKQNLKDKHGELTTANSQLLTEISNKEKTEKLLKTSLSEKEIIIKETHHRVKNNLQVISSLLNLQAQHQSNKVVADIMLKSQLRVHSMALVHDNLYQSNSLSKIDLKKYTEYLLKHIIVSFEQENKIIKSEIICDNITITIDNAIPCGLIINEIVTNSMKYAFIEKDFGLIKLNITQNDKYISFIISDDGVGFDSDIDVQNIKSLGFKLIYSLVDQLNGKIYIKSSSSGTEILFNFLV